MMMMSLAIPKSRPRMVSRVPVFSLLLMILMVQGSWGSQLRLRILAKMSKRKLIRAGRTMHLIRSVSPDLRSN